MKANKNLVGASILALGIIGGPLLGWFIAPKAKAESASRGVVELSATASNVVLEQVEQAKYDIPKSIAKAALSRPQKEVDVVEEDPRPEEIMSDEERRIATRTGEVARKIHSYGSGLYGRYLPSALDEILKNQPADIQRQRATETVLARRISELKIENAVVRQVSCGDEFCGVKMDFKNKDDRFDSKLDELFADPFFGNTQIQISSKPVETEDSNLAFYFNRDDNPHAFDSAGDIILSRLESGQIRP